MKICQKVNAIASEPNETDLTNDIPRNMKIIETNKKNHCHTF